MTVRGRVRNLSCPCGSGNKYKNCCARRHEQERRAKQAKLKAIVAAAMYNAEKNKRQTDENRIE